MNGIEQLKNELLLQMQAIISKGGEVVVAGTNPSPAEITAGILSIPSVAVQTASALNLHSNPVQENQISIDSQIVNIPAGKSLVEAESELLENFESQQAESEALQQQQNMQSVQSNLTAPQAQLSTSNQT